MADIQACSLCKLRFSDAESPEQVHGDCLEAMIGSVQETARDLTAAAEEARSRGRDNEARVMALFAQDLRAALSREGLEEVVQ